VPRIKNPNLRRIHLTMDKEPIARLEFYFGATIGVSEAIRIAITRFLREHEDRARIIIDNKDKEASRG
jgi:hypothetical protein